MLDKESILSLVPVYEPHTPEMVVPSCNLNWED